MVCGFVGRVSTLGFGEYLVVDCGWILLLAAIDDDIAALGVVTLNAVSTI